MPFTDSTIIAFLSRPGYSPMRRRELARAMRVPDDGYAEFRAALDALVRDGRVALARGRRYVAPERAGVVTGRIATTGRGFGFVRRPEPGTKDFFVPPDRMNGAMDGDLVVVEPIKGRGRRGAGGKGDRVRVVRIIERGRERVAGTFVPTGAGGGVVLPDSRALSEIEVFARDAGVSRPAPGRNGKVLVEVTRPPRDDRPATGRVVRVLGEAGTYAAERDAVIAEFGLLEEYPEDALAEVEAFGKGIPDEERLRRADYTGELAVTIDPADARDFDDAISVKRSGKGWTLRVHIADVSHYVAEGTALDREARLRATSCYLPGEAIHMLPPRLSADLCSLKEGEVRPTKAVTLRYDDKGAREGFTIERSLIRSRKRLTYAQVRRALEGESVKAVPGDVLDMLTRARELHELLRDRRRREGSFCFSLPEARVVLGEDGGVVGIEAEEQDFSHNMIEEFMLEANRAVAEVCVDRALPAIYRIHEEPDREDLKEFAQVARAFGIVLKPPYSRERLANVVERADAKGLCDDVAIALLRAMKLARYYEHCLPHYALAFERYLHFTSPIRRYPDLWVHRLLDAMFEPGRAELSCERAKGKKRGGGLVSARVSGSGRSVIELREDVAHVAEHCSHRERSAEKAERALQFFRRMEFLRENSDGLVDAVVRDVNDDGLWVELERFFVRGRVPLVRLPPDRYRFHKRSRSLGGKKYCFAPGDRIEAKVLEVDLVAKEVSLAVPAR
ncbi:MAG: ribonuclease R family protein [Planctomycetota bacterium]